MKICHVAPWTRDQKRSALSGRRCLVPTVISVISAKTVPASPLIFMRLREGATIELMTLPELEAGQTGQEMTGWAHIAIAPGDEHQVDEMAVRAAESGILIAPPRRTGDGFDEAIIRDSDGNLIELVAE